MSPTADSFDPELRLRLEALLHPTNGEPPELEHLRRAGGREAQTLREGLEDWLRFRAVGVTGKAPAELHALARRTMRKSTGSLARLAPAERVSALHAFVTVYHGRKLDRLLELLLEFMERSIARADEEDDPAASEELKEMLEILCTACQAMLADTGPPEEARKTVFQAVPKERLRQALDEVPGQREALENRRVDRLIRDLRASGTDVHALLQVPFRAAAAPCDALQPLEHLRQPGVGELPKGWPSRVFAEGRRGAAVDSEALAAYALFRATHGLLSGEVEVEGARCHSRRSRRT